MAEIRAKLSCVFRMEIWLLIDIRRMRGCFWGDNRKNKSF